MGGFWKKRVKEDTAEKRTKHFLNFLKSIRAWHLFLILIPLLFMSATFLRFDHLRMNDLKTAVLEADRAGEDEEGKLPEGETQRPQEEITAELSEKVKTLKKFTESHTVINFIDKNGTTEIVFGTGPFYLEHQYNRLALAALQQAQVLASQITDDNPNGNVYAYANSVCQPQAIRYGWAWNSAQFIACMTGEINKYPVSDYITEQISASIPNTALFRYDFVSPVWSPTLSGFAILLSIVLIIIIIVRVVTWLLLRIALIFVK
ncbi:hypothetical protein J6W91_01250 [Candidatus Saccharibacteria bacterium]|nr:hypothetical protein [Candidatus Saccharibacteria bacterium]